MYWCQILAWRRTNYKHCDETIVIHFAHACALFFVGGGSSAVDTALPEEPQQARNWKATSADAWNSIFLMTIFGAIAPNRHPCRNWRAYCWELSVVIDSLRANRAVQRNNPTIWWLQDHTVLLRCMAYIQTRRAGLWLKNKGALIQNKETMMRLDIDREQACLDIHNE